jgi:hypothetical protein
MGRIYIELINAQFLKAGGTPDQFRAAVNRAIAKGWLERHESGTYVKFTRPARTFLNDVPARPWLAVGLRGAFDTQGTSPFGRPISNSPKQREVVSIARGKGDLR